MVPTTFIPLFILAIKLSAFKVPLVDTEEAIEMIQCFLAICIEAGSIKFNAYNGDMLINRIWIFKLKKFLDISLRQFTLLLQTKVYLETHEENFNLISQI